MSMVADTTPLFKESVAWYDANLDSLLPKYRNKFVAVCGDKVCGSWDDQMVGLKAMVASGYKPGTFIVHKCLPLDEENVFVCHTADPHRMPSRIFA